MSEFRVDPNVEIDGTVEIVRGAGNSTVLARVRGDALRDYSTQHWGVPVLAPQRLLALVEANLPAFSDIIDAKRRRGESHTEGRFGSNIEVVDIGREDLRSGPALFSLPW